MNDFLAHLESLLPGSARAGFGAGVVAAAQRDPSVVVLCADLRDSLKLGAFTRAFPRRFFEVGVAEQNLVGIAAGLAAEGHMAVAASYAAFSPGRTHDQIRVSVCYSQLPVCIVGGHAGLATGPDGATHQALEDIALMRALPNMTVLSPHDQVSAQRLTEQALSRRQPVYIRLPRVDTLSVPESERVVMGKALELVAGTDITIAVTGVLVERALLLARALRARALSPQVLVFPTIKPLDTLALEQAIGTTGHVLTLEDHQVAGGFGSAVSEWVAENAPSTRVKRVGVQDVFGESGTADELFDAYGFSIERLEEQAMNLISPTT